MRMAGAFHSQPRRWSERFTFQCLNVQSRHLVFPSCVVKSSQLETTSVKHRPTKRTLLWFHAAHSGPWNYWRNVLKSPLPQNTLHSTEAVLANFTHAHCWRWMLLHTEWWQATPETKAPPFVWRHCKRTSSEWGPLHTFNHLFAWDVRSTTPSLRSLPLGKPIRWSSVRVLSWHDWHVHLSKFSKWHHWHTFTCLDMSSDFFCLQLAEL